MARKAHDDENAHEKAEPVHMLAYLELMRPLNCLMAAFAAYTTTVIAGFSLVPSVQTLLGALAVFLICAGGMALNDFFDFDIDRVNKPKRPLPSGRITKGNALTFAAVMFAAGVAAAYFVNTMTLVLALFATFLLILYAWRLKRMLLIGHIAVSVLVALTFVYGGALATSFSSVAYLAALAFLANLSREIFKSIDDVLGDEKGHVQSLAIKYGVTKARMAASVPIMAAIVLSFVPFLTGRFGKTYLYFVAIANLLFLMALITPVRFSARICKFAMLVALFAFLAGAITA